MKGKSKRRLIELGKDLLILALLLSAVLLALRSQVSVGLSGALLSPPAQEASSDAPAQLQLHPTAVAVNLEGVGRFAVQYDREALDQVYAQVFTVLSEALGSAEAPRQTEEAAWRTALSQKTGVYFDFGGVFPLPVLCAVLDVEGDAGLSQVLSRCLLVAQEGEGVALYYYNESDKLFYVCTTSEALSRLLETAAGYSANGARFAYEEAYPHMAPYLLLLPGMQAQPLCYRAYNPLEEAGDDLLFSLPDALGFHPQPNSAYRQEDRLVFNEWPDTLNILNKGEVLYEASPAQTPRYPVEDDSPLSALEATWPLAQATVGSRDLVGEAALRLLNVQPLPDGGWQVEYGSTLDAIPVRQGEDAWCARFLIREGAISSYTIRLRGYASTGETSLLLPEAQAAAAQAALGASGELLLVYGDPGSSQILQAQWIAG